MQKIHDTVVLRQRPISSEQLLPSSAVERAIRTDFLSVSRRGFIRRGMWLGIGVAAAGVSGLAYLRRSPRDALPSPTNLQVLSASQYQLFVRLAELCFPSAESRLLAISRLPIGLQVDGLIAGVRIDVRKQLLMGLDLFDNAAVLTGGHWQRLVDMPEDAARAYIDGWTNSSVPAFRAIANAATRLTKSAYWSNPETWSMVNFPGPVTGPRSIERLGNAPSPTRAALPRHRTKAAAMMNVAAPTVSRGGVS